MSSNQPAVLFSQNKSAPANRTGFLALGCFVRPASGGAGSRLGKQAPREAVRGQGGARQNEREGDTTEIGLDNRR
jgi:hypothetical protein